jgi:hypothetical protein
VLVAVIVACQIARVLSEMPKESPLKTKWLARAVSGAKGLRLTGIVDIVVTDIVVTNIVVTDIVVLAKVTT